MANNKFVSVNWSPGQLVDEETLDQLNANQQYLRDQSVDGKIQFLTGSVIDTGVKVLAGNTYIAPNGGKVNGGAIGFTNMFTPGSEVIVTATLASQAGTRYLLTINGLGGGWQPDYRGFSVRLTIRAASETNELFTDGLILNWIAVGY